jgi:hypothetical protein
VSDSNPDAPNPAPAPGAYPPPPAYNAPDAPAPAAPAAPPAYSAPPAYGTTPGYGTTQAYGTAPAYGAAPAYSYGATAKTNTLAIVSLIASIAAFIIVPFVGSVVGVITGHMSLNQLKTSGEQGRGMALAGTIVGWVGLGLAILGIIAAIAFFGFFLTVYQETGGAS